MADMDMKVRIMDLPQFNLFRDAAPAWLAQVSSSGYQATDVDKKLFGAIMAIAASTAQPKDAFGGAGMFMDLFTSDPDNLGGIFQGENDFQVKPWSMVPPVDDDAEYTVLREGKPEYIRGTKITAEER